MSMTTKKEIIIVDNDQKSSRILADFLITEQYSVVVAHNITDARKELQTRDYDLVLANPNMMSNEDDSSNTLNIYGQQKNIIYLDVPHKNVSGTAVKPIAIFKKPASPDVIGEKIQNVFNKKGFTAILGDLSLSEYIQLLSLKKATKAIFVGNGREKGVILLREGHVIFSIQNLALGEEAFFTILGWHSNNFKEIKVKKFPQQNIFRNTNSLLIDHQRATEKDSLPITAPHAHISTPDTAETKNTSRTTPATQRQTTSKKNLKWLFPPKLFALASVVIFCIVGVVVGAAMLNQPPQIMETVANINSSKQLKNTTQIIATPLLVSSESVPQRQEGPEEAASKIISKEAVLPTTKLPFSPEYIAKKDMTTEIVKETIILRLHGSNTIGAELAPELAEHYLTQKLGANKVERKIGKSEAEVNIIGSFGHERKIIEIHAHGSSTGFQDLDSGSCDVAMASRKINPKEQELLSRFGNMLALTNEHVLALDGVAIIVNKTNTINQLSLEDLSTLFTGETSRWNTTGLKNTPVTVYARDDNSGTYDTFKSIVFTKDKRLSPTAKRYESNATLSDTVASDTTGVGFTSLSYVNNSKPIAISETGATAIYPSFFTVATEDYPLSRRLYLYTSAQSDNLAVLDFVEFSLSATGQNIVKDIGFVDMNIKAFTPDSKPPENPYNLAIINNYFSMTQDAQRLSVNFRFNPNSIDLDNRAMRDVERMVDYLKDNMDKKITLVGFADNSGDYNHNLNLANQRARSVEAQLKMRGLQIDTVISAGEEIPVATNATATGRDKNRRVEVWVK